MRNRNNHRRHSRRRDPDTVRKNEQENVNHPDCAICGKPVRDISSAVASRETGEPCHFDCVLRRLAEEEHLAPDERICYLGHGVFGVGQPRQSSGPVKFVIKKRIQYENTEQSYDWRKQISIAISSLIR